MLWACEVCGHERADVVPAFVPCERCWDGRGDAQLAEALVGIVASLPQAEIHARLRATPTQLLPEPREMLGIRGAAVRAIGDIRDPRMAPAVRAALADPAFDAREEAIRALGRVGDPDDTVRIEADLASSNTRIAHVAIAALEALGGAAAADALAGMSPTRAEDEVRRAAALVRLDDPRGLPLLRGLTAAIVEYVGGPEPLCALLSAGDSNDVEAVIDAVMRLVAADTTGEGPSSVGARRGAGQTVDRLRVLDPAAADRLQAQVESIRPRYLDGSLPRPMTPRRYLEPLGPRVVPKHAMAALSDEPGQGPGPSAKFGGQPDWREAPAWPLTSRGTPMIFYGQLPLLDEPGEPTAYIFLDLEGDTWEPLSDANSVIAQPGVPGHLPTVHRSTGPAVLNSWVDTGQDRLWPMPRSVARYVTLEAGHDPFEWTYPDEDGFQGDHGDWNKIGGTPNWLQAHEQPPGDGWRYVLQFGADWAGYELGDGAVCYCWLRDDGLAAFGWQCH